MDGVGAGDGGLGTGVGKQVSGQAVEGSAVAEPVLEEIAPAGAVEMADDKSCLT
ncbi:hypothetical protein ACFCX3_06020 [Streptomyces virginiae]|uniref:hypothetical protein n=1 Tax=Streptomyces virginiae TaxID=1961 RepID=UPI0035E2C3ED